ncbi:MAG: phosphatidylglycerophosphatase C [Myxococcota bacterium]|jgi:phosphatidylglycerophosphatase C
MSLALFDFDGTLTRSDTMFAFVRHVCGGPRMLLGLLWLSPMLVAHKAGLVSATRAKEVFLRHFFGGHSQADLEDAGRSFADVADGLLRDGALERVQWHQAEGHRVVVVSASVRIWLGAWCERHGLELLCTEPEWVDGRFTGGLGSPNCNGAEKVARVRALLDPEAHRPIHAYGDSGGDRELLALADTPDFRPFR